jgi:hypothetical protein
MALTLFRKGTPWTRAYVRRDMEAWYVSGRPSSPKHLLYGEEVIIVANRAAPTGAAQIVGSGTYDVYRWDGTCVSVMADEVAVRPVGFIEFARISWKRLDDGIRQALEQNEEIAFLSSRRRKACGSNGAPEDCETAIDDLSRFIADYVRRGGEVPLPRRLP